MIEGVLEGALRAVWTLSSVWVGAVMTVGCVSWGLSLGDWIAP